MYQIYISYIDCYHVLHVAKQNKTVAALKPVNIYCDIITKCVHVLSEL